MIGKIMKRKIKLIKKYTPTKFKATINDNAFVLNIATNILNRHIKAFKELGKWLNLTPKKRYCCKS